MQPEISEITEGNTASAVPALQVLWPKYDAAEMTRIIDTVLRPNGYRLAGIIPEAGGPAACLAGSCSQATLGQIAMAEAVMPVRRLDPERLLAGPEEAQDALAWAAERIGSGPVLIASSASPEAVTVLQARHGREAAGHAIEAALAGIAEGLVARGVRRLVVAGGETSGAVVQALGVRQLRIGAPIDPGVPWPQAEGRPLLLALKSGNFGAVDFFAKALEQVR